mgnify:CR=1 FL=1
MPMKKDLIDRLALEKTLSKAEFSELISGFDDTDRKYAAETARKTALKNFGNKVYIRGLIEISSFCKNDCLYCGLRRDNAKAERYRLSKDEILSCCETGYPLGFRTFVLQGGEDLFYTDEMLEDIVVSIKKRFPDCAVTLSLGEKSRESYERLFNAGADRYLLRHETASKSHYSRLHPPDMALSNRMRCLYDLKEIGFQTGCGFMVGSPFQTPENIAEDLLFMKKLDPQMVGRGPFIPQKDTPFGKYPAGDIKLCLFLLSLIRIMLEKALLPATTALGTAKSDGRELGILSGANVIMPNLSPADARKKYLLYDNKLSSDEEASENIEKLRQKIKSIGYEIVTSRGDY